MKILVAEDDRDSRDLVHDIVLTLGYQAIPVADGRAALECARQDLPDLIILDINMPLLDGFEVCEALRASRRRWTLTRGCAGWAWAQMITWPSRSTRAS